MEQPVTIPENNANFPEHLAFERLREIGIEHCQSLGSQLWTDFNIHDPGLTILEVLVYALTDLGYRTQLPIEDLLTRPKSSGTSETSSEAPVLNDDNFFSPEEIQTCNPVSLNDLRRTILDVENVRNVWIEMEDLGNQNKDLVGLYKVFYEPDNRLTTQTADQIEAGERATKENISKILHSYRNLCEDFVSVETVGNEKIRLTLELELDANASPEDVLVALLSHVDEFLSPTLRFYSLQELLDRGKKIEEIFAGRPFIGPQGQSHGFIDTDDLTSLEPRTSLFGSDLFNVIAQIDGVTGVRDLIMESVDKHGVERGRWKLPLKPNHRQLFDLLNSEITFFKQELLPQKARSTELLEAIQKYKETRISRPKVFLSNRVLNHSIPAGRLRRDLGEHRSIMHEFPGTYRVGNGGVAAVSSPTRKAQALQLRGYLLFYDQILANYLSQLTNLRELFSISPNQKRTYFSQPLRDSSDAGQLELGVPEADKLIHNYSSCEDNPSAYGIPENYTEFLEQISENESVYSERRNQFLDHLLARFSESFTDHVLLMYDLDRRLDEEQIISNKTRFLQSYPETSRNRGKGFNYKSAGEHDSVTNVSGLENRVRRLLGIQPRSKLTPPVEIRRLMARSYWKLQINVGSKTVTIQSRFGAEDHHAEIKRFLTCAAVDTNYRLYFYDEAEKEEKQKKSYGFAVADGGEALAALSTPQSSDENRNKIIQAVKKIAFNALKIEDVETEFRVEVKEYTSSYSVDGSSCKVVFQGTKTFDSEDAKGHAALIKEWIRNPGLFNRTDGSSDNCPAGAELLDPENNEVVARLTSKYSTSTSRDAEVERLFRLAVNVENVHKPIRRQWGVSFRTLCGQELLRGAKRFDFKIQASKTFEKLIVAMQSDETFKNTGWGGRFSFSIESESEIIAVHPRSYYSKQERDLVVSEAKLVARSNGMPYEILKTSSGDFSFILGDKSEAKILHDTRGSFGSSQALDRLLEAFLFVKSKKHYRLTEVEDKFGFELWNSDGQVIATHPQTYDEKETRNEVLDSWITFVRESRVSPTLFKGEFFFAIETPSSVESDFILRSSENFRNEEEAKDAFEKFKRLSKTAKNFTRTFENCKYHLRLTDGSQVIAEHPIVYNTMDDCDQKWIEILELLKETDDLKFETVETRKIPRPIPSVDIQSVQKLIDANIFEIDLRGPEYEIHLFNFPENESKGPLDDGTKVDNVAKSDLVCLLREPVQSVIEGFKGELESLDEFKDEKERDKVQVKVQEKFEENDEFPYSSDDDHFVFKIDYDQHKKVEIKSHKKYLNEREREMAAERFRRFAIHSSSYRNWEKDGKYGFDILNDPLLEKRIDQFVVSTTQANNLRRVSGEDSCERFFEVIQKLKGSETRIVARIASSLYSDSALQAVIDQFTEIANSEGFYLVEHILLRPQNAEDPKLNSALGENETGDPYSFIATVVVPYWPKLFRSQNFRQFFERTIFAETPAHNFLQIRWASISKMREFETVYREWRKDVKNSDNRNRLVEVLNSLKDVPIARLSGELRLSEYPFRLNNDRLGGNDYE